MTKRDGTKALVKIGLMSGLNYGSSGCREGFWRLAAETFKAEAVNFIVLVGGLVDAKAMQVKLKERLKGVKPVDRAKVTSNFIQDTAEYFRKSIPKIPGIKIYIITSPAYDGLIGEEIARQLVEKRRDILLYRDGGDRLEIKQVSKFLGVYAPKKGAWMRGDYFDTPAIRVLKDELKRSTRGIGDTNIVGCLASSVYHPGDSSDIKRPYLTLPLLYKITETRTAENQIGLRILKIDSSNLKEATVITYNFKDLASDEWSLVQAPPESSTIQKILIETLKTRGPLTVGQLEDFIGYKRDKIKKSLDSLVKRKISRSWPGIFEDEVSHRYYFTAEWFEKRMEYPVFNCEGAFVDAIAAFGCLHASCKHTDMKFFRDEFPNHILEHNVNILIGCGDFIEGLKHDLMTRGEIYGGRRYVFNYTNQEKLSAYLVSQVISKVFRARIDSFLKSANISKASQAELELEVKKALLTFIYIPGNHCEWTAPLGFDALSVFKIQLKNFIVEDVIKVLAASNAFLRDVSRVVDSKIVELHQNQPYTLASGLTVALLHPYMSRTKTTSIRPQEMLGKSDTQIVIGANFHVAESVEQWEFEKGQRVCLQVGTIKRRSGFEDTKLKTVDFGIGLLKVWSLNKKIKKTETSFHGVPTPNLEEGNEGVLKDFENRLGLASK